MQRAPQLLRILVLFCVKYYKQIGAVVLLMLWNASSYGPGFGLPWRKACSYDSEGAWAVGRFFIRRPPDERTSRPPFETAFANSVVDALTGIHVATNHVISCEHPSDVITTFTADPFLVISPSSLTSPPSPWYLFYESKDASTRSVFWNGHAVLSVSSSVDFGKTWQYGGVVLREPFHLSYPFVFFHNGQPYMIPETSRVQEIRLYTTDHFPYQWHVHRVLLRGRRFADTSLLYYQSHWYMFFSEANNQGTLWLYHSANLDEGWAEHAASPIVENDFSCARPGGRPMIDSDGRILRFAQNLVRIYGGGVCIAHITKLTPFTYAERKLGYVTSLYSRWNTRRVHHIDAQPVPAYVNDSSLSYIAVFDGDSRGADLSASRSPEY
eukprot:TRINITY_DN10284_c0_g1_i1.p1 TRINITY_DN10284_c0_g1~~TRINITY_DN10284_c0_g1_i1.p1  ORF type:complete len:382 (+),score=38.11 TRINITY_DN10284_c0_g1_i1:143-1288(+)